MKAGLTYSQAHELPNLAIVAMSDGTYTVYENGDVLPTPTAAEILAAERAVTWEKIKERRDSLQENGGVLVGGKWYKSSQRAIGEYNSIIQIALASGLPDNYSIRPAWRTMADGVTEIMTPALAKSILLAGFTQYAEIDDTAQLHKIALLISLTPLTYDYSGGWPATFS